MDLRTSIMKYVQTYIHTYMYVCIYVHMEHKLVHTVFYILMYVYYKDIYHMYYIIHDHTYLLQIYMQMNLIVLKFIHHLKNCTGLLCFGKLICKS